MSQFFIPPDTPLNTENPQSGFTKHIGTTSTLTAVTSKAWSKLGAIELNNTAAGTQVWGYDLVDGISDNIEIAVNFSFTSDTGKQGIASLRYSGTSEATTKGYTLSGSIISGAGTLAIDEGSTGYAAWTPWNYLPSDNAGGNLHLHLYSARFRIDGNRLRAKVWTMGGTEPDWMLDTTNDVTTTGNFNGLHTYMSGNVDYFSVGFGTNGDSAPLSALPMPTSTPQGVYGGGYGGPMGYGGAYGNGITPAFTVKHIDYTANAFIDKQLSLNYAANALIVYLKSSTYTANAFIDKQNKIDSTSNAFIDWQLSLTHQANACIERIESLGYTSNAEIESYYFTSSVDYTSNARIERASTVAYSSNAFIENQRTITHVANAFIEWQKSVGYTANAFVEKQNTLNYMANAFIDYTTAISYEANAFVEWQLVSPYTASAFVEWVKSQVYTSNARIERAGQQIDYDSNARIERIEQLSYTASANISNPVPDQLPSEWDSYESEQSEWKDEKDGINKIESDWSQDAQKDSDWSGDEAKESDWKTDDTRDQRWEHFWYDV